MTRTNREVYQVLKLFNAVPCNAGFVLARWEAKNSPFPLFQEELHRNLWPLLQRPGTLEGGPSF